MHGLRDKDPRILRAQFKKERRAVLHHRNELFVPHPRGVKEDVVAEVTDPVNDLTRIPDRSVIGAELNHREAEGALRFGALRIRFRRDSADVILIEAVVIDPADEPIGVPCGFEIHRRGTRLNQGAVLHGLVVIAVVEHQVTRREKRSEHHLV